MTLTNTQISTMLALQAQMNAKINPNWQTAGYPFLRAAALEVAEAMEHQTWKWWKAGKRDLPQLQMELIDIVHFMLAHFIVQAEGNLAVAAMEVEHQLQSKPTKLFVEFDGKNREVFTLDTLDKLELQMGLFISRRVSLKLFEAILVDCEMTWDDVYRQYIGKNVLNFFRQDNGYKSGEYVKVWEGREDNEHLVEILAETDPTATDFKDVVYLGLAARYQAVILAQG